MDRGCGIVVRCYNLSITELLWMGTEEDIFKVYMRTAPFVSMLEDGTQYDILRGNLYGYKGAIFENLIADVFGKMGRKLYYFHKDSGLEVDFVIRYKGQCTLVEVKASTGNTKSTRTILRHPEKYHVSQAIKLGDYNVDAPNSFSHSAVYGVPAERTVSGSLKLKYVNAKGSPLRAAFCCPAASNKSNNRPPGSRKEFG
ncbi:MAG: DUF4143 domain-containing protein [Eubacteriales bacterium]